MIEDFNRDSASVSQLTDDLSAERPIHYGERSLRNEGQHYMKIALHKSSRKASTGQHCHGRAGQYAV